MKPTRPEAVLAGAFSGATLLVGYLALGFLPAFLFAFGFVGGFVLWLAVPTSSPFPRLKLPYFLTLGAFILHKIEERQWDFFPALAQITDKPVPEPNSVVAVVLYACAAAWLLVPWLVNRRHPWGYYLAWTFFTSMGVIELAHFVFPLLTPGPYGYFPGMVTVVLLAPAGWWGMTRLVADRQPTGRA